MVKCIPEDIVAIIVVSIIYSKNSGLMSNTLWIYGTPFATKLCHRTGAYKFDSLIDFKIDYIIDSL